MNPRTHLFSGRGVRIASACAIMVAVAISGPLWAQSPDEAALRAARKLRAEAAYQEVKGKPEEAARLFEESLKHVPDEKIAAKVRELRGEAAPVADPAPPAEAVPATADPTAAAGGADVPPVPVADPPGETPVPPVSAPPGGEAAAPALADVPAAPAEPPAAPEPNTVRRKVNDQCPDEVDIVVEVDGLEGTIPAGSPEELFFRPLLPASDAVRGRENDKFGNESQGWADAGPHVLRTGYARAGSPVTVRVVCPEKPPMTPVGEGIETVVRRRTFDFEVYDRSEARKVEVEVAEDRENGTLTWTPARQASTDIVCGPTVIGVYVNYAVERQLRGHSMGTLAGGRHRVGWIVVAYPGMPVCVENRLYTVVGDGRPAELRAGWALPELAAEAVPRVLLEIDQAQMRRATIRISEDYRRVARIEEQEDGSEVLFVDGVRGPVYEDIGDLRISRDARTLLFVGKVGRWEVPVVNGVEGPAFARVDRFTVTADGAHHAFVGLDGGRDAGGTVVLDGKVVGGLAKGEITALALSPDASRIAWVAKDDAGSRVVLDGQEGPVYPEIPGYHLRFGGNGQRFCYLAREPGKDRVVLDGKVLDVPCSTKEPVFSPDGARLAYVGVVEGGEALVLDGVAGPAHPSIWDTPTFSPDGKRIGYVVSDAAANQAWAVIDGVAGELKAHNRWAVSRPVFSPDGGRVAYAVKTAEKQSVLVVDGREASRGVDIRQIGFSPDGKRVAWFDKRDDGVCAVVDGVSGAASRDLYTESPVFFSPDGAHFFTLAREKGRVHLYMDHAEIHVAEVITPPLDFSRPGKVRFAAYDAGKLEQVEVALP